MEMIILQYPLDIIPIDVQNLHDPRLGEQTHHHHQHHRIRLQRERRHGLQYRQGWQLESPVRPLFRLRQQNRSRPWNRSHPQTRRRLRQPAVEGGLPQARRVQDLSWRADGLSR